MNNKRRAIYSAVLFALIALSGPIEGPYFLLGQLVGAVALVLIGEGLYRAVAYVGGWVRGAWRGRHATAE